MVRGGDDGTGPSIALPGGGGDVTSGGAVGGACSGGACCCCYCSCCCCCCSSGGACSDYWLLLAARATLEISPAKTTTSRAVMTFLILAPSSRPNDKVRSWSRRPPLTYSYDLTRREQRTSWLDEAYPPNGTSSKTPPHKLLPRTPLPCTSVNSAALRLLLGLPISSPTNKWPA